MRRIVMSVMAIASLLLMLNLIPVGSTKGSSSSSPLRG